MQKLVAKYVSLESVNGVLGRNLQLEKTPLTKLGRHVLDMDPSALHVVRDKTEWRVFQCIEDVGRAGTLAR